MSKDDAELVLGSTLGYRRWTIDALGRLWGAYGQVWRPGVNHAACGRSQKVHLNPQESMRNCSCGFYAYYNTGYSDIQYGHLGTPGIIEATGIVVEGGGGFRAQKAEIKALVIPHINLIAHANNWVGDLFKDKWHHVAVFMLSILAMVGFFVMIPVAFVNWGVSFGLLAVVLTIIFIFIVVAGGRRINLDPEKNLYRPRPDHLVKKLYPEVDIFRTERDMIRAYKVPDPTPEIGSDEFWALPKK